MSTIYVSANSKKEINARLANGEAVRGEIYDFMQGDRVTLSPNWQNGDVIKVYSKRVGGQPYAKAYGQVTRNGDQVKVK